MDFTEAICSHSRCKSQLSGGDRGGLKLVKL